MPWESTGGLEVASSSDDDDFLRNLKNIPKPVAEPKSKPKPESKPEPTPEPKPEPKPEVRTINKPEIIPEAKPVLMRSRMPALLNFNESDKSCIISKYQFQTERIFITIFTGISISSK